MADKTFNIYCDESCHLEHDHKRYMFLGSVHCAFPQVKRHTEHIKALKRKHHFFAEIKWTNVSLSKWAFYQELTQYFFESGMCFRAVGIDKDMDKVELLFTHLTTKVVDKATMHREYDRERSIRLHWIRHHIEEQKRDDMLIFSTVNGREKRTYIYDKIERYVIVLEPKAVTRADERVYRYYYFLTAYKLEGKDAKRNKIERLYARRHPDLL